MLLCGLVAGLFAAACGNTIERKQQCRVPGIALVLPQVDVGPSLGESVDQCKHTPVDFVPSASDKEKIHFTHPQRLLLDLNAINFSDYFSSRCSSVQQQEVDVSIASLLLQEVTKRRLNAFSYAFLPPDLYFLVCSRNTSGCESEKKVAVILDYTAIDTEAQRFFTLAHELGHVSESDSRAYDTWEKRVVEEGKAYMFRLAVCLGVFHYNSVVGDRCLKNTLAFVKPILSQKGSISFEKALEDFQDDGRQFPVHDASYLLAFALLDKTQGDVRRALDFIISADSLALYTSLITSKTNVEVLMQFGALALDEKYGTESYTYLFGWYPDF